jgi:hypothetical protein
MYYDVTGKLDLRLLSRGVASRRLAGIRLKATAAASRQGAEVNFTTMDKKGEMKGCSTVGS